MPLSTFAYFQKVAAERLGAELPPTKGDDDGTIFTQFLKERQSPPNLRSIKLETILEIFEKYKASLQASRDRNPPCADLALVHSVLCKGMCI